MANIHFLSGWEVHSYDADSAQIAKLGSYLAEVTKKLPEPVLSIVRRAKIFVHRQSVWKEKEGVMTFHWCREYLMENGRNLPESAVKGSIEIHSIGCLLNILNGWLGSLIHEFGHAFHYHYLSSDADQAIKAAYEKGRFLCCHKNSYAVTNKYADENRYKEHWACLFTSYFDSNDCQPKERKDLQAGDPEGYDLIHRLITNSLNQNGISSSRSPE